ncbi:CRISPR-associated endonuclease Cas3'', partial [Sphingomonas adhaesiva]|uniref:CRISPR-associated endonuclease Cas3'' n=1 Tax=Sphingomonas adhaesiva TaxID=28212 RepID=UPI002FFB5756
MMDERSPWAKLARDGEKRVTAALPLVDHCLDVGAAFSAIVPAWRAVLTTAAGRALTDQDIARLTVLVALHDLGKANRGFQARYDDKVRPIVGHTAPVAALLNHSTLRTGAAASALHAMIAAWDAREHFAAVMAHHGRPLQAFYRDAEHQNRAWIGLVDHWWPKDGHDPAEDVMPLIEAARARWPLAWEDGPPLPDAPRFVALFEGLVTLADWLGSDERRFPIAGPHGAARDALRQDEAMAAAAARGLQPLTTPDADFVAAFGNVPYGFQQDAAAADLGAIALIEAETGSGKTEAALWRWLELRRREEVDGLFFALPTRAAAVQLHARVDKMLQDVWGSGGPRAVLAIPGYRRVGDAEGQALPGYRVRWDKGEPGAADDERWAAERANRFLAARVAVGTIDQALLGTLPVKHALFRAGVLARSLLVVDEVHASDAYMTGLLGRLLEHHVAVGGRALLLSATLGGEARARFMGKPLPTQAEAEAAPYPAVSGVDAPPRAAVGSSAIKRVTIEVSGAIDDAGAIAARAVAAARAGASVLVVRNTVDGAVAVARAVAATAPELAFTVEGVATVHHGRFAPDDR